MSKRIHFLFSHMAAIYGHVWRSQYKSDLFLDFAKKEWQKNLSDFDDEVFMQAVESCHKNFEMPPNLSQFYGACVKLKKIKKFEGQASKEKMEAITAVKTNPAVYAKYRAQIFSLLQMKE